MDKYNRYAWDFSVPVGSPIVASRSGVVHKVKSDSYRGGADRKWLNDGNSVVIDHLDGSFTLYLHLTPGVTVRVGEYVIQGQVIGAAGWTGYAQVPHLHYTAQQEDGVSVASSFVDIKQNEGIPRQGNQIRPARNPAVPQELLDRYLNAWRACKEAERLGLPDLALAFATSVPKRSKHDYFYHAVLSRRAAVHRQSIVDQAAALFNDKEPDGSNACELLLLQITLSQSKDRSLKKLASSLRETLKTYPESTRKSWQNAEKPLTELIAAWRAECKEQPRDALNHYIRAFAKPGAAARNFVQQSFSRFAKERSAVVIRELSSLAAEVDETPKEYRPQLRDAAAALWPTHDLLLDVWERRVPDSGVEPIEVRARAERLLRKIRETKAE